MKMTLGYPHYHMEQMKRSINIIKPFIYYIIEINNSNLTYQNLKENIIIRYIVPTIEI